MVDYYTTAFEDYFKETFSLDPSLFLNPLVRYLRPGASILDVGCGSGRDMLWLSQRGYKVTGLERSRGLASLAGEYSGCRVIEADFENYDFSNLQSDSIILVGSLVHVPHRKFASILKNIITGLRYNGKALITVKEGTNAVTDSKGRNFFLWKDDEIRREFERAGIRVVEFSRQTSVLREEDVWLSYVIERSAGGAKRTESFHLS